MARLELHCPNGCAGGEFEALNAPLIVDRGGRYVRHRGDAATYVCVACQSVAVDLAGAAREMQRRAPVPAEVLRCPSCGLEMLPPEDEPLAQLVECPACETRFGIDEGRRWLLGGPDTGDDGAGG